MSQAHEPAIGLGHAVGGHVFVFGAAGFARDDGALLVRLLTQSIQNVGLNVGRLSAISTLGSVAGTVLIGYVLIPRFPNSVTMLITTGILIALAAVYLIVWGRGWWKCPLLALGLSSFLV